MYGVTRSGASLLTMDETRQLDGGADSSRIQLNAAGVSIAALPCWCGRDRWSLYFRNRRFGLLRCSGCGTYQIDPPPLRGGHESADFYTDYYSKLKLPTHRASTISSRNAWFWKVAEKVPRLAEVRQNVLDIGSGDGHFCGELRGAGWPSVAGIEISRTRVARAREFYSEIPFYDCPIADTNIPEQSLDLIVMDSVIEHLPNPFEMVRDLRRYLKSGGMIVLLTPNMESGHFRFLGRRWTGMLAPHAHIFLFTAPALSRLLTQAGFMVSSYGSLHMPTYSPVEYVRRAASGDVKGTLWRAHQEMGGLYGRAIGAGPMLYLVASRA